VAKALAGLLAAKDDFVRTAAARALATWGTPESVPALIAALEDRSVFVRGAAMAALGAIRDPRGAEAVAKQLPPFAGRGDASKALQAMGELAEAPVLPFLGHADWGVQMEACKILGVVGTSKSLQPLRDLPGQKANGLVIMEAEKAIKAIEARLKNKSSIPVASLP